jgi:integrase
MARVAIALGEHGDIQTSRQVMVDGAWKMQATGGTKVRIRARTKFHDHDGAYRHVTAFGGTKKEALAKLDKAIEEHRRGRGATDTLTARTTISEAGRLWVARIERPDSDLSARSVDDYRRTFFRYVDAPGSSVRNLTLAEADDPQRLERFLREVADTKGNGALKQTRVVLRHIMETAVRARVLRANPLREVAKVRARVAKPTTKDTSRAFTRDERDAVVSYAYELADGDMNPRTLRKRQATADLVCFLAYTGVRIEEARSLDWSDIDLVEGSALIRGTKTEAARRRVDLAPKLLARLTERAERVGTDGYVFAAPAHHHNGVKWDQSNSNKAITAVFRGAGFPWASSHSFRRTAVTLLHEAGTPLHEISDWVGHADTVTTSRYLGRDLGSDKKHLAARL